ncbi:formyltransferase family protein [Roseivirga sp.]|uniref:formyltransferase family protein n=1 Tax=Roseivirga sp. TaxID=1964215 RepID=UPI003B527C5B
MSELKIQILVDNPNSWIIPYARELVDKLKELDFDARLLHRHSDVVQGDILCLLSCERIFRQLNLNQFNLVVHESDLPKGKGWSPVTWQVLEGKKRIPVTLLEASEEVDAGPIYDKEYIDLEGYELLSEIKHQQGLLTQRLILKFLSRYPNVVAVTQSGKESFYEKRGPEDSRLDPEKSLGEQFELLRVCDNERYPAFFTWRGKDFIIRIYRKDNE